MGTLEDPFQPLVVEQEPNEFAALVQRPAKLAESSMPVAGAIVARLHGFALDDSPLIGDLPQLPGEIVAARTTVALKQAMIGTQVVVLCEQGDVRRPIIMGVLNGPVTSTASLAPVAIQADEDRYEIRAEREIVLRCGDASITLTRAGKVIIKGNYVLSRSSGYNKIKGAAVDIN